MEFSSSMSSITKTRLVQDLLIRIKNELHKLIPMSQLVVKPYKIIVAQNLSDFPLRLCSRLTFSLPASCPHQ